MSINTLLPKAPSSGDATESPRALLCAMDRCGSPSSNNFMPNLRIDGFLLRAMVWVVVCISAAVTNVRLAVVADPRASV